MSQSAANARRVEVWDLPTRLFHWSLLALVVVAWLTGEGEGGAANIHRFAGEAIAGLIVFRVIWGFVGGEHARFADFAAGPTAIATHVRDLFSKTPKRDLGHNALGGVAVFLLLITAGLVVVTGLFSGGDDNSGPFAGLWGLNTGELHEALFRILQILVVIHLVGIVFGSLRTRDALVPAMITGIKTRRADEPGANARRAGLVALLVALIAATAVSAALMTTPPSHLTSAGSAHGDDD